MAFQEDLCEVISIFSFDPFFLPCHVHVYFDCPYLLESCLYLDPRHSSTHTSTVEASLKGTNYHTCKTFFVCKKKGAELDVFSSRPARCQKQKNSTPMPKPQASASHSSLMI